MLQLQRLCRFLLDQRLICFLLDQRLSRFFWNSDYAVVVVLGMEEARKRRGRFQPVWWWIRFPATRQWLNSHDETDDQEAAASSSGQAQEASSPKIRKRDKPP